MTGARARALNAPLTTARLFLEPLTGAHADVLFPLLADPATRRFIPPPKAATVDALRERWAANERRVSPEADEAWLAWAVRRATDGAWLGKLDANVDDTDVATNLGYVFGPFAWGQGYATEAVGAVVAHLVGAGIHRLRASVTRGNVASCRVLERVGFVHTGVRPDAEILHGVAHDDLVYELEIGRGPPGGRGA